MDLSNLWGYTRTRQDDLYATLSGGRGPRREPRQRLIPLSQLVCSPTSCAGNALDNPTFVEVDLPEPPHASNIPLLSAQTSCPPRVEAVGERRSARKAPRPFTSPPRKAPPKSKGAEELVQTENDKPKRSRGPKSDTLNIA